MAGVPKNILPLLFLSPGQNPRGGYTWPKKNLFSKPIVAGPRRPIDFESTIEFQFQPYLFFFFLLPFFSLFTHVRANVRTCKRSREEIIFPKKKKKKNLFRLYAVSALLLNRTNSRKQVKNSYERGIKEKFPARGYIKS